MALKNPKAGDISDDDMMGDDTHTDAIEEPTQKSAEATMEEALLSFPERAELENKLTETEQKLTSALHAIADRDNQLRRAERKVDDAHKYSISKLLEELIPVLDSLEQSLTIEHGDHALVKSMGEGMALTLQMLQKVLAKFGVKEIYPLNEAFNPALHEVMLAQENAEKSPNTVLAVLQKGYQLHDRIIRPARVIVAKAPVGVEK